MKESVVAARNVCYRVVPIKVSILYYDKLDRDFSKEELFAALSYMWNDKSPGVDDMPCEFYKIMWGTIGDI